VPDSVPLEELDVEVSGGRLAAFRIGAGRASAPLVLAVHGITSNSRAWLPLARVLDGRASVVAVDLRGRAASHRLPGPYGMAAHVNDLLAVLDRLDTDRAVLVGHSLGAYIVAGFGVEHPQRVHTAVLVEGGLTIPGIEDADPQVFTEALLGPAIARLNQTYPTRQAYYDWWRQHPAFADSDVADEDLVAYADHDLIGTEPQLRSSVIEAAIRADAGELGEMGCPAHQLELRATLLVAPRGLQNDPTPMQPLELAQAWAAEDPRRRHVALVPDVNHYTITMGAAGAAAVAETVSASLPG
jgi:pimeloyl-ACP methyl ester carboxylesterase